MKVVIFLVFILALNQTFGQCGVNGTVTTGTNVACNDCVTLTANGMGGNTSVFMETFNSGNRILFSGWRIIIYRKVFLRAVAAYLEKGSWIKASQKDFSAGSGGH